MKRWTLLVIPHSTEAPRSYTVSERLVRGAVAGGAVVLLVAAIGAGSLLARFGHLPDRRVATTVRVDTAPPSPEVVALRARVGELRGMLDTIRTEDARLRAAVGAPGIDSSTLLRRFLARLPRVLRPSMGSEAVRGGSGRPVDSLGAQRPAEVAATTDSLMAHAAALAGQYRAVGPARLRLDTLEVLSLRPESLRVAANAAGTVRRSGRTVHWLPSRSGAILAGFDAEVARALEQAGVWQIDLRAAGGLTATVSAQGQPAVHAGDRVLADQPVMLVSRQAGGAASARYEIRRNGIMLDPTFPGSLGLAR